MKKIGKLEIVNAIILIILASSLLVDILRYRNIYDICYVTFLGILTVRLILSRKKVTVN